MKRRHVFFTFICFGLGLIGFSLWLGIFQYRHHPILDVREQSLHFAPQKEIQDPLVMGYGWSEHVNAVESTKEALAMMAMQTPDPKFILTFYTQPYDPQMIRDVIYQSFPDVKVMGMQSAHSVFTADGVHSSENGAIALLGFYADDFEAVVEGSPLIEGLSHEQLAGKVISQALSKFGKDVKPAAMITGQPMWHSEKYCNVLNRRMDRDIPMIGGNQVTSQTTAGSVIINEKVYDGGFVMALLYTNKKVGADFHSGFSGRMQKGIVTKIDPVDNHVIVEIDHRPAAEVYNEWTEGEFAEYMNLDEPVVVTDSVLMPLSKMLRLKDGSARYLTIHPWRFNLDGSINLGTTIDLNDKIYIVKGDENILIKRAGSVTRKSMVKGSVSLSELAGGVHIYCEGAGHYLNSTNQDNLSYLVDEIKEAMGSAPFIGGFFGGEQGVIEGHGYFAANLMSSMMVFSQENNVEEEKE